MHFGGGGSMVVGGRKSRGIGGEQGSGKERGHE